MDKPKNDWNTLVKYVDNNLKYLNKQYEDVLKEDNIEYLNGYGSFANENLIKVTLDDGTVQELSTEHVLLAMGCRPVYP